MACRSTTSACERSGAATRPTRNDRSPPGTSSDRGIAIRSYDNQRLSADREARASRPPRGAEVPGHRRRAPPCRPRPLADLAQRAARGEHDQSRTGHRFASASESLDGRRLVRPRDVGTQRAAACCTPRPRQQLQHAPERLVVAASRADGQLDRTAEPDDIADARLVEQHVVGVGDDAAKPSRRPAVAAPRHGRVRARPRRSRACAGRRRPSRASRGAADAALRGERLAGEQHETACGADPGGDAFRRRAHTRRQRRSASSVTTAS